MKIKHAEIIQKDNQIIYQADIESLEGKKTLWYSLPDQFANLMSDLSDAPLVAMLMPAMARGEDIHIEGSVSDRLFYNLKGPLQFILRSIIPALQPINIYPENVCSSPASMADGVATGYSGGIDSYCVLADHFYADVPKRLKINHLFFNNVGSHGAGGETLFRQRYERLSATARRLNLPVLTVNSNLPDFYSKKLRFQQTHTLRDASVALLLQKGIGRYMYASSFKYADIFVGRVYDTAYSEPITLPMLSTDSLDLFSVGSEYTRVQKTLRITELPDTYDSLDVCINSVNNTAYANCSTCWKCLRTMLTLDIAGCLDRYAAVFDLNAFKQHKKTYVATMFGNPDPLNREIVEFAKVRDYSFPISSRLLHYTGIYSKNGIPKRINRKLKKIRAQFA